MDYEKRHQISFNKQKCSVLVINIYRVFMVSQAAFRGAISFVPHNNWLNLRPLMWKEFPVITGGLKERQRLKSEARNVNQPADYS